MHSTCNRDFTGSNPVPGFVPQVYIPQKQYSAEVLTTLSRLSGGGPDEPRSVRRPGSSRDGRSSHLRPVRAATVLRARPHSQTASEGRNSGRGSSTTVLSTLTGSTPTNRSITRSSRYRTRPALPTKRCIGGMSSTHSANSRRRCTTISSGLASQCAPMMTCISLTCISTL